MDIVSTRTANARNAPWDPAGKHRFVTSDGTALHLHDPDPDGDSPTVLLVHGWTLDHTSWDLVAEALPEAIGRSVRILRYDHRGHGGSSPAPPGTATVAQVADDLAELIAARVPHGPIVLAGHSMGGMAIMALAERHPELVAERIVGIAFVATSAGGLADATFGLPRWLAGRAARIERGFNRRLAGMNRSTLLRKPAVARPGLRWLLFGSRPRKVDVMATAAQVGRCHPRSMAGFRESLGTHERRAALAALRDKPVVLLAGGADRLTPLSHARVIAEELPNAEFVVYPGAGHMLGYERASEVATRIARLTTS